MNELLQQIAEQATEVRKLQKAYFRTKRPSDLIASKRAERTLDELLARYAMAKATGGDDAQQLGFAYPLA